MHESNTHDMLKGQMHRALARVILALDLLEGLPDDPAELTDEHREYLDDLWVALDEGDWDPSEAADHIREDLDPLAFKHEQGLPFEVALTLGGPNIYLVDFGGHGGARLVGYWGEEIVHTGRDVTRALDFYRDACPLTD